MDHTLALWFAAGEGTTPHTRMQAAIKQHQQHRPHPSQYAGHTHARPGHLYNLEDFEAINSFHYEDQSTQMWH